MSELARQVGDVTWVSGARLVSTRSIVDLIAPGERLETALQILTVCGLGEPRLWLRSGQDLSDGERFRAGLARAIGRSMSDPRRPPIFCDEFTASLQRRSAKAIAFNLRKLASRMGLSFVLATAHEDIIADLQPDQTIRLGGDSPVVTERRPTGQVISLRRQAVIEPGTVREYRDFAPMHYRQLDGLGFVDCVFVLRDRRTRSPLGAAVFAHAPMELALRNLATRGRFTCNLRRVNRELRILRRLVMHPDVRGCGLGQWFVRQSLPRVGVRFIECLAGMGAVNPVFEKAGMNRIGQCPLPRGRMALVERLRKWKLDPFADDFGRRMARLPRVREMVEKTVQDWISSTHGAAQRDVSGRRASELVQFFRQIIGRPPIYYLWDREREFPRAADRHRPERDGFDGNVRQRVQRSKHDPG